MLVGEHDRAKPEHLRERRRDGERPVALPGDGRPGAVELLGPAIVGEGLERVEREPPHVRRERVQRRAAAHVRDPRPRLDSGGDLGDRAVGHAEKDDVRLPVGGAEPALGESRAHRASDASRAHR